MTNDLLAFAIIVSFGLTCLALFWPHPVRIERDDSTIRDLWEGWRKS